MKALFWLCFTLNSVLAQSLPAPLQRILTDYENAWRAKDPRGLAALFDDDGFVLPSGRNAVRGRAAIEKYYAGHGGPLYLSPLTFATHGNTGFIIGTYRYEPAALPAGKFTLALVKRKGRWLIKSDMDNSNPQP